MNSKKIIGTLFVGMFFFISMPVSLWAGEPGNLLMETIDKGLSVLKEPSLQGNEKLQERRQRLWQEISPVFNFEEMSKRALGLYWQKRSPDEKKEFVELFTNILKETYIGKTDTYSGEKIVFLGEKQEDSYANVQTKLITSSGTEVSAEYRLLKNTDKWRIYDVIIEGVSLVNNYRSQFYSILSKSPYAKLLDMLKEKNKG